MFHQTLIKNTNNETYFRFSEIINDYFSLVKIDFMEKEETLIHAYEQHLQIIEAIKNKNLLVAQNVLQEHFKPIFIFLNQLEEATSN